MSWSSPRTWVTSEVVTAALLNAHVRDNLLETAPANVTTAGDIVYATAANALARLAVGANKTMLTSNGSAPAWSASPTLSGDLTVEGGEGALRIRNDSGLTNATLGLRFDGNDDGAFSRQVADVSAIILNNTNSSSHSTDLVISVEHAQSLNEVFRLKGSGVATIPGGLNVGSATGAATGELRASASLKFLRSGTAAYSSISAVADGALAASASAILDAVSSRGALIIADGGSSHLCMVAIRAGANAVYQGWSSDATTFNVGSDAGTVWAIFHNGSNYVIKNRTGSPREFNVINLG